MELEVALLRVLWRAETRRALFCNLYRCILKDLERHPVLKIDSVAKVHVRIKARYIIELTRDQHELKELAKSYQMLKAVHVKLQNPKELIYEAYGLKKEEDINSGILVDQFNREVFTPRDIGTIFLRANRKVKND